MRINPAANPGAGNVQNPGNVPAGSIPADDEKGPVGILANPANNRPAGFNPDAKGPAGGVLKNPVSNRIDVLLPED